MLKKLVLSALVFSVGALLAFYGVFLLSLTQDSIGIRLMGLAPAVLGVLLLACLLLAWRRPNPRMVSIANWASLAFVVLFLVGSFDHGIVSGFEFVTTFIIGSVLALVCWCLRALIRGGAAVSKTK
ncbi:MAG: hypothetical protein ACREBD_13615 [Blastocatellia bacterium]